MTFDVVGSRLGRAHAASLADKLKAFRFTGLGSSEGKASGWVGPEHLLDSDFDPIKIVHGPFLTFGYRVDKRKVPSDVLAAHVAIELAARPEATAALRAGLMLRRASVTIARGGSCWTCSLDGETFDVSGLKIARPEKIHEEPGEKNLFEEGADAPEGDEPKAPAEKVEAHDAKAERLGEAADLRETIDALFATFLETRLSPVVWPEVERAMRTWVLQKGVKEAAREARELEEVNRELFADLEDRNPRCAAAVAATLAKPHGVEVVTAALEVVKSGATPS